MVSEPVSLSMANQDQTSRTSSSPSVVHRELSPMEDPRSPFFLHHGESPGAILATQPLTEHNYPNWARAMLMALDAKSNLGFVDGSITASMAHHSSREDCLVKEQFYDFFMNIEFSFTSHFW